MLSQKLHDAMNAQVNAELWSAYLYLAMSLDAEAKGHKGVANWFYIQFQEEQAHARIYMFRQTLEHEKKVTALINNLAAIADADKDYASVNRLAWFIDEQVEEEESAREMICAFEAVEGNRYGMYMLDKELAARVYNVPSPLAVSAE